MAYPTVSAPYGFVPLNRFDGLPYAGATVVDTRVIDRTGCWDELCHMNPEGHKKIGMKVIQTMKFHIIK